MTVGGALCLLLGIPNTVTKIAKTMHLLVRLFLLVLVYLLSWK